MTDTLSYPFLRKTHKASSFPCRETVREGGTNKKKKTCVISGNSLWRAKAFLQTDLVNEVAQLFMLQMSGFLPLYQALDDKQRTQLVRKKQPLEQIPHPWVSRVHVWFLLRPILLTKPLRD